MKLKNVSLIALLPLFLAQAADAGIIVNDSFNNSNLQTVSGAGQVASGYSVHVGGGNKTVTETTSALFTTGDNPVSDWAGVQLQSSKNVGVSALVGGNNTVVFSWTLQNVATTLNGGNSGDPKYRIQLGLLPASNIQGGNNEMFSNTSGGIWMELRFNTTNATSANFRGIVFAGGPKGNGDAPQINLGDYSWDNSARTFSLTLDATGFSWSDSASNAFGNSTYAAAGITGNMTSQDQWGFQMGQNFSGGGVGSHEIANFSVLASIPEPAVSMLLLSSSSLFLLIRRRRSAR